jgi:hypothetical protein
MTFLILSLPCNFYNSQITHQRNALYFHFIFFILKPLHMFRPLQGHLQGARKLHSLHIQCFCLLSHLVQFYCQILQLYTVSVFKVCKNTEYKILKKFVNFRCKMLK